MTPALCRRLFLSNPLMVCAWDCNSVFVGEELFDYDIMRQANEYARKNSSSPIITIFAGTNGALDRVASQVEQGGQAVVPQTKRDDGEKLRGC